MAPNRVNRRSWLLLDRSAFLVYRGLHTEPFEILVSKSKCLVPDYRIRGNAGLARLGVPPDYTGLGAEPD